MYENLEFEETADLQRREGEWRIRVMQAKAYCLAAAGVGIVVFSLSFWR